MTDTSPGDVDGALIASERRSALGAPIVRGSLVCDSARDGQTCDRRGEYKVLEGDKTDHIGTGVFIASFAEPENAALLDVTTDDCTSPGDETTGNDTEVSTLGSVYLVSAPKELYRKSTSKKKKRKRSEVMMRRLLFRIPKLVCYLGIALLVVFALKKLNELSDGADPRNKASNVLSGEDVVTEMDNEYTDEIDTTEASNFEQREEKLGEIGKNVNRVDDDEQDVDVGKDRLERDVDGLNRDRKSLLKDRARDPDTATRSAKKERQDDYVRELSQDGDDVDHDDDIKEEEEQLSVDKKFVEHVPPKDFRYRASGDNGEELKARREFHLKPLPRHMAEIVLEEPEPDDEADPAHAVLITGASTDTFNDVVQLILSVQKYLPKTKILVYDIGLQTHQKIMLKNGCNVELRDVYLSAFPRHVQIIDNRNWRPLVMQMALAEYHFIVWADPKIRLSSGRIQPILKLATQNGVGLLANPGAYSTFSVTNPAMYDFIPSTNVAKFKTERHLEVKLLAVHSSEDVQERFMRWLALCAVEKGCLAPKNASPNCETPLKSHKYANCHRYDESAVNILLKNWFDHDVDKFYVRNLIAVPVLSTKITTPLKQCPVRTREL